MTGAGSISSEQPYLVRRRDGWIEYQLPISVKGVIIWRGRVPLLKNERDEWELPGGKLEIDEQPEDCVRRETQEELGWSVEVHSLLSAWVYEIRPDRHVFVVAYDATYEGSDEPSLSHEHKELRLVQLQEVRALNMPQAYKDAVAKATSRRGGRS